MVILVVMCPGVLCGNGLFSLSPVLRVDEYVLEFFVVDGHIGCHVSWSPLWKWSACTVQSGFKFVDPLSVQAGPRPVPMQKPLPELIHGTDTSLEVVLLKPKTPSQSSKNMKLVSPLSPFPVTPFLSTSTKLKVHGILAAEFLNRFIGQVTPFGIRPPPNWEQLKFFQLMKSRWIPSLDQVTPFDPFGNS